MATVAVVALAGHETAWYPWTLLIGGAAVSVTANALHAVVAADADVPGVLAAAVAAVPPVVLLAITHLTVILTRPQLLVEERASTSGATSAEEPASAIESLVVQKSETVGIPAPEPTAVTSADAEVAALSTPGGSESPTAPGTTQAAVVGSAERTVGSGTDLIDRRARAAELRAQGWSNKKIARELDVHPSTVGRWFTGAHLPDNTKHLDVEEARTP
ncbi:MAG: helix-turn-helix domain-containing protein [Pseudonocardia sp.]|nr:helix-turn-helix domain-containing protein [Pseudonocardia sp.]